MAKRTQPRLRASVNRRLGSCPSPWWRAGPVCDNAPLGRRFGVQVPLHRGMRGAAPAFTGARIETSNIVWIGVEDSLPVPEPHQSGIQLLVRRRTVKLSYFNAIKLGPETPIAPGRGENRPFGERFGRSFRSRSPKPSRQTPGKLGIFHAVSPGESGSPLGWWRRIGNWERKVSACRELGRRSRPSTPSSL